MQIPKMIIKQRCILVLGLWLLLFLPVVAVAKAHASKPLTVKQAQAFVHRLILSLSQDPFFHADPLSRRVALSLLTVNIPNSQVTARDFTNMVLTEFLNSFHVSVVNQDPAINEAGLDYSLISYDDPWTTRKRGLFLGADYIVTGELATSPDTDSKGKPFLNVRVELQIHEVRSNAVVVKREFYLKNQKRHNQE